MRDRDNRHLTQRIRGQNKFDRQQQERGASHSVTGAAPPRQGAARPQSMQEAGQTRVPLNRWRKPPQQQAGAGRCRYK